jgi:hypothetical protein
MGGSGQRKRTRLDRASHGTLHGHDLKGGQGPGFVQA